MEVHEVVKQILEVAPEFKLGFRRGMEMKPSATSVLVDLRLGFAEV
jgi:hypothetical protein